jgi:hypothetical protein
MPSPQTLAPCAARGPVRIGNPAAGEATSAGIDKTNLERKNRK